MMTWYAVHLTNDEVVSGRERALTESWDLLRFPRGAAVFSHYNFEDGSTDILISPEAVPICIAVAKNFGAARCDLPQTVKGVSLLLGDQRDIDVLLKNVP